MADQIDDMIALSFKFLAVLWVAGAIALAAAVWRDGATMRPCSMAELHLDTCPY